MPPASRDSVAASPSVVPRAPVTPPPPSQPYSIPPTYVRPPTEPPAPSATAQLEQRLGSAQLELRRLGSERHTLRARLRREANRVDELESALRAEKDLRRQASEEHQAALAGLRARLSELTARTTAQVERLEQELAEARSAARAGAASSNRPQGLRRIRGIGPSYQRALEALGVTEVRQVARWTSGDTRVIADKLKIRVERILKEDWIGQARALESEAEAEAWG